jgi:hypothetical protein
MSREESGVTDNTFDNWEDELQTSAPPRTLNDLADTLARAFTRLSGWTMAEEDLACQACGIPTPSRNPQGVPLHILCLGKERERQARN